MFGSRAEWGYIQGMSEQHYIGHAASFMQVFPSTASVPYEHYHIVVYDDGRATDYFTDSAGEIHEMRGFTKLESVQPLIDEFLRNKTIVPKGETLPPLYYNPAYLAAKAGLFVGMSGEEITALVDRVMQS